MDQSSTKISYEIISTFLEDNTIEKAKKLFKTDEEKIHFESNDITYRLYKGGGNLICFEFPIRYAGEKGEDIEIPNIGKGNIQNEYRFFNPVGFFTFKKELFNTKCEAVVLNQFEAGFDSFKNNKKIHSSIPVSSLSFIENALIGAFSAEAIIHIKKNINCKFRSNGIDYYIVIADDGDPQIFVDKKYDIDGDNCMSIFLNDRQTLYANSDYEDIYNRISPLKIFSMNKFI